MINTLYIALFIIIVVGIITLVVLLYRNEKFTPVLIALPNSPIPDGQNLPLSSDKGKLTIVNTEQYNDFLNKVNTDLTPSSKGVDNTLDQNIKDITNTINSQFPFYVHFGNNVELKKKG